MKRVIAIARYSDRKTVEEVVAEVTQSPAVKRAEVSSIYCNVIEISNGFGSVVDFTTEWEYTVELVLEGLK